MDVPGVGAFFFEEVDDALVDGLVVEGFAAFVAEEDGDGDAPDALAGDAPVGAGGDHVGDALFAPGGVPFHFLDVLQRAAAQGSTLQGRFHGDEPLVSGAEDNRIVTAPAVRIGVLQLFRMQEHATFL